MCAIRLCDHRVNMSIMRSGNLPLMVAQQRHPSFLDAAFEARRAIASATTEAGVTTRSRAWLCSFTGWANASPDMAETGLLNVDITASGTAHAHAPCRRAVDVADASRGFRRGFAKSSSYRPSSATRSCRRSLCLTRLKTTRAGSWSRYVRWQRWLRPTGQTFTTTATGRTLEASLRVAWETHAPSSPSDTTNRFARALSEKLRGAALAAGGGDTAGTATALEYARQTRGARSDRSDS